MADNRLLARLARQHGGKLLDGAIDKLLPTKAAAPGKVQKNTITGGIATAVLTRIALRSVPGALLVGGGLLAKRLHERRQAAKLAKAKTSRAGEESSLLTPIDEK